MPRGKPRVSLRAKGLHAPEKRSEHLWVGTDLLSPKLSHHHHHVNFCRSITSRLTNQTPIATGLTRDKVLRPDEELMNRATGKMVGIGGSANLLYDWTVAYLG